MTRPLLAVFCALILTASTDAQSFRVALGYDKPGSRKIAVEMLDGPHAGERSARRLDWSGWLRESAEVSRAMVLRVDASVERDEVSDFVKAAMTRYGVDSAATEDGSPFAALVAEVCEAHRPLLLSGVVLVEGGRLDPWSGRAWSGVGHFVFDTDREVGVSIEGETFSRRADIEAHLAQRHAVDDDRLWVFDPGLWSFTDLSFFRGVPERVGHRRFAVRGLSRGEEERWGIAGLDPLILDVSRDGAVRLGQERLLDPTEFAVPSTRDPYRGVRERLVELTREAPRRRHGQVRVGIGALLIRTHPATPMLHVARLMDVCGHRDVLYPRVDLAIAGQEPIEAERLTLPLPLPSGGLVDAEGETAPEQRVPVTLSVTGAERKLSYELPGGALDRIESLLDAFRGSLADGQSFGLALEAGPGVTASDVMDLLRGARSAGVSWITVMVDRRDGSADYSIPVLDR